jgi:hypothetical protein
MNIQAVAIALHALFAALPEDTQDEIVKQILFNVNKHRLEGINEHEAVSLLRGY